MKFKYTLLSVVLFVFIACSKDDTNLAPNSNNLVTFHSSIGTLPVTKAEADKWAANDAIGVFMKKVGMPLSDANIIGNAQNKKYITTSGNGSFSPVSGNDVYYPADGSSVDFIAYYPHQTTINNYTYNVNVSNQNTQSAIDLLYANDAVNLNKTSPIASLNFTHQLSKLIFNVKAGTGVTDLNGLTIKISGMKTSASFNLENGNLVANYASVIDIAAKVTGGGTTMLGEAIVLPVDNAGGCTITFSLPTAGDYKWDVPVGTNYQKGNKYIYDVELRKTNGQGVSVAVSSSITDWISGASENISLEKEPGALGDGTFLNPYTINQLSSKIGETSKWVQGYIVGVAGEGSFSTKSVSTYSFSLKTNIIIAAQPNETNYANCIPVELVDGSTLQACLNLADNASLLNKPVKLQGNIAASVLGASVGIKNLMAQVGGVNPSYGWFETPYKKSLNNTVYVLHYLPDKGTIRNFSMLYDNTYKLAYWVAYPLHASYIGNSGRTDAWAYDPKIPQALQPKLSSGFSESGIDRGHQIPSADRTYSKSGNATTFYYSNMTAQNSQLNQGIWAGLENKIRAWMAQCDTLYVVTGAMITTKTDKNIVYTKDNENKQIAKPKYYYKALAKRIGNTYYTIGFKMDNAKPSVSDYNNYRITVKELENETGFTFFPSLPDDIKSTINNTFWQ